MDERLELAYRRLERARESLTTAENVLNLLDDPKTAANRTYYAECAACLLCWDWIPKSILAS
ncbi:MAG: hypothetical protein II979_09860 [Clostridia bacterium]|nr:hypothetical protein [Clostridia bacterium]